MSLQRKIHKLNYLFQSNPYPLEKPVVIQFPVNDICNSKCQMCHIWKQKREYEITASDLRNALKNPLYSNVATIGINGGEPTLRKDLPELVEALYETVPKLKNISLITNAFKSKQVIERIFEVGKVVQKFGGYFDVMVSLDGFEEVHDVVRGRKGNFQSAHEVTQFLKETDFVGNIRFGCTIIKDNVYGLHDLHDYAVEEEVYIKYRLGIPHQRLYSKDLVDPFALSFEDKIHIAEFLESLVQYYEKDYQQTLFYRSLIDQLLHQKPRKAGCDWQHRGATIGSKGELLYCAVASKTLGNINSEDSHELYFQNKDHLKYIHDNECDRCHHDYQGLPAGNELIKVYGLELLKALGIDKDKLKPLYHWRRSFFARTTLQKRRENILDIAINSELQGVKETKTKNVLICGWYGTETLGDKAILGGVIESLKSNSSEDLQFFLANFYPYVSELTKKQMPDLGISEVLGMEEASSCLKNMGLLVFGGGPIMGIDLLADIEGLFIAAEKLNIPRVIAGCGVGPMGNKHQNNSIKNILKLSSSIVLRDQKSKDTAVKFGIEKDIVVAEDPAFLWLSKQKSKVVPLEKNSTKKYLGLGLRSFPYHEYARHLNRKEGLKLREKFEKELFLALENVVRNNENVILLPIPMCTNHFGGDDRWFYRDLFRRSGSLKKYVDFDLLSRELSPLEYLQYFQKCNFFLAMRFHSAVFALSFGVPTIAIDYTLGKGKVKSLSDKYGIECYSLDEITEDNLGKSLNNLISSSRVPSYLIEIQFQKEMMEMKL